MPKTGTETIGEFFKCNGLKSALALGSPSPSPSPMALVLTLTLTPTRTLMHNQVLSL